MSVVESELFEECFRVVADFRAGENAADGGDAFALFDFFDVALELFDCFEVCGVAFAFDNDEIVLRVSAEDVDESECGFFFPADGFKSFFDKFGIVVEHVAHVFFMTVNNEFCIIFEWLRMDMVDGV